MCEFSCVILSAAHRVSKYDYDYDYDCAMPHASASVSERRSIRWPPAPASEPTDTLVLSGPTGVFVDVRFLKDAPGEGVLDWAFAGFKEECEFLSFCSGLGWGMGEGADWSGVVFSAGWRGAIRASY